ncbi:hypothetical protein H7I76_10665 [Mycolicibacterium vaccae]|nr:hypothetical protein [Mycolicibacterium vaccae]
MNRHTTVALANPSGTLPSAQPVSAIDPTAKPCQSAHDAFGQHHHQADTGQPAGPPCAVVPCRVAGDDVGRRTSQNVVGKLGWIGGH